MLSAHYRSPLNFSAELMEASKNGLERILTAVDRLRTLNLQGEIPTDAEKEQVKVFDELVAKYEERYQQFKQIYPACKPLFDIIK